MALCSALESKVEPKLLNADFIIKANLVASLLTVVGQLSNSPMLTIFWTHGCRWYTHHDSRFHPYLGAKQTVVAPPSTGINIACW